MQNRGDKNRDGEYSEPTDVDEDYVDVPQQILMFEEKLERHFQPTEEEHWYRCENCHSKVYYSRKKPQDLARHLSSCEGTSGRPDFNKEIREA